jgi:hypothetical protein
MDITKLRGLIQESIQEYLKEIDAAGDRAAVEAKMAKIDEAIKNREDKISRAEALTEDEDMKEMVNTGKIASMKKEIKLFEKAKAKYQKQLDKMDGKTAPKANIEEEPNIEEETNMDEIQINESFVRMQKLAGLITESEYKEKTDEVAGPYSTNRNMGDDIINNNADEVYQYNMFDRMDILANIQDLNTLKTKLRLLVSDWYNEGFEKEDIQEYMNFLIDEI